MVRYATLSSMDLPLEVRFLIIMIARFADVHGVASVANSTLCEICRTGSHHTVERWISLAADVGILRKEPGKGGKDRKSNSYTLLGADRDWVPLPVGHTDTNPIVALAHARLVIEELLVKAARFDDLEAETDLLRTELALLRNGHANGHSVVTNGEDEPTTGPPGDSYETADSGTSQETHGAIGHSGVTNGSAGEPAEDASHSYETLDSGTSQEAQGAIGHSEVTNGPEPDEGQEYLSRRARVQELVMNHRDYYTRSFNRGGLASAVEYFSRSPGHEQELMDQVALLEAGGNPRDTGADPPPTPEAPSSADSDRYAAGQCPDCGRPFATHGGETHCTDCTERRRRESEA